MSLGKSVLNLHLTFIISSAIVGRRVISDGEARTAFIVEGHILVNTVFDIFSCLEFVYLEVNYKFFLDPSIERLVDRVVCGFSSP